MKKLVILLIIMMLCACSSDIDKTYDELDNVFSTYEPSANSSFNNNNSKYFSFYLPNDINELDYDDTYSHLKFNDSDFIMCLNVNSILANDIFENKGDDPYYFLNDYTIYSYELTDLVFNIYLLEDNILFSFYSNKMTAFGSTTLVDVKELARHILALNDSIVIDNDKVIDNYYSGTAIDSVHQAVNLFSTSHAKEGYLKDIIN